MAVEHPEAPALAGALLLGQTRPWRALTREPIHRQPRPGLLRSRRGKTESSPLETVAPPRNFTLSVEDRLRAYAQGVPSYIRRRRRIEELEARLLAKLAAAAAPAEVAASIEVVDELALLNDLIDRHNRYYPIEAQLPIDIRTSRLLERGVPWQPLAAVTMAELLGRAARSR